MWIVFAESDDTLVSAEQTLACNCMIIRNKLTVFKEISQAMQLWAFCLFKYPKAKIVLSQNWKILD